jgi:hypothetical protein
MRYAIMACFLGLAACAQAPKPAQVEKPILTREEQAYVAQQCADGCAIIPRKAWLQILLELKSRGI